LVTPGTVEERIVQRAEKKLYLDKMVNRDAHTQDTSSLDDDGGGSGKGKGKGKSGEEEDASGVSGSDLLAALSFGAQAVFRAGRDEPPTDAELDAIIDRTRTDDFSCGKLTGGEAKTANAFDAEQVGRPLAL
jgi:SWI/SNF-related matrix-associated actin-dependent regulator of chromatin subfamily A member 5